MPAGVVAVDKKPVPVTVTVFSAELPAEVGEIALTVGAGLVTEKESARGSLVPLSVVTVMS